MACDDCGEHHDRYSDCPALPLEFDEHADWLFHAWLTVDMGDRWPGAINVRTMFLLAERPISLHDAIAQAAIFDYVEMLDDLEPAPTAASEGDR